MNKDEVAGPQHYTGKEGWTPGDLEFYQRSQNWEQITDEEHQIWQELYDQQIGILPGRALPEYFQSLKDLKITGKNVPKYEDINKVLKEKTGWTVIGVPGLIPAEPFFEMLSNRIFPVGNFMRTREQFNYIQEPDAFHDLFGHVPLLTNQAYADFIQAYGRGGMKATKLGAVMPLSRLYWHTIEFGLINTDEGIRIFGAGLLSSPTESKFCLESDSPHRIKFNLERMMCSAYNIDDFQEHYFVINSFDDLVASTKPDFSPIYERLKGKKLIPPMNLVEQDQIITKGTCIYAIDAQKRREERLAKKKASKVS